MVDLSYFILHCLPAKMKIDCARFILNLTLKTGHELYILSILPSYTYTAFFSLLLKSLNERTKNLLTCAVSGERYFYLWPRFSIKYWRWASKDSHDGIKAEWWLNWSLKGHPAVWRSINMSSIELENHFCAKSYIFFLDSCQIPTFISKIKKNICWKLSSYFHFTTPLKSFPSHCVRSQGWVRSWETFRSLSVALIRLSSEAAHKYELLQTKTNKFTDEFIQSSPRLTHSAACANVCEHHLLAHMWHKWHNCVCFW